MPDAVRRGLCYPVPLRDFTAQLVLPYDLTPEEVERLSALLRTLLPLERPKTKPKP